jgi:hypothetical protein
MMARGFRTAFMKSSLPLFVGGYGLMAVGCLLIAGGAVVRGIGCVCLGLGAILFGSALPLELRRIRFSLRKLLILMTIAALLLGTAIVMRDSNFLQQFAHGP